MHIRQDSAALVFVALAFAACGQAPDPATPAEPEAAARPEAAAELAAPSCGEQGFLRASLSGALNAEVDWAAAALRCESMRRPDDRGVRLRFTGEVGGERLAIIISIPELDAGETGAEFDSVVTVTVEGSGRFFSTPNLGACWTDIETNAALPGSRDAHVVAGSLSCVGPLGEFNGDAYVEVRELRFSGIGDWNAS